ncbi:MAG TPA: hypothetical protein VFX59_10110 [Polyangiales bacterium]|nr:hypothetical protein [Polyangiales bacterium]
MTQMAYSMLGQRGLLMLALGCVGCDAAANEDADPSQQGLGQQTEGDGGFLQPTLIGDAGRDFGLNSKPSPKTDAGVQGTDAAVQGDAGQGEPTQGDAGQTTTHVQNVEPSENLPDCAAVYFRDLDGDGYGDPEAKVTSCTQPAGYVLNGDDCYDDNERAHPAATGQFLQDRGDGSFDYDCDGVATKLRTTIAVCPDLLVCNGLKCELPVLEALVAAAENGGWSQQSVPACGQDGSWGLSVSWLPGLTKGLCVSLEGVTRTQTCR